MAAIRPGAGLPTQVVPPFPVVSGRPRFGWCGLESKQKGRRYVSPALVPDETWEVEMEVEMGQGRGPTGHPISISISISGYAVVGRLVPACRAARAPALLPAASIAKPPRMPT